MSIFPTIQIVSTTASSEMQMLSTPFRRREALYSIDLQEDESANQHNNCHEDWWYLTHFSMIEKFRTSAAHRWSNSAASTHGTSECFLFRLTVYTSVFVIQSSGLLTPPKMTNSAFWHMKGIRRGFVMAIGHLSCIVLLAIESWWWCIVSCRRFLGFRNIFSWSRILLKIMMTSIRSGVYKLFRHSLWCVLSDIIIFSHWAIQIKSKNWLCLIL